MDVPEIARLVSRFLDSDLQHRARSYVLESATRLEAQVSEVLAVRLSANVVATYELAGEVYSRLPMGVRLDMLRDAMSSTGADELWPFLVPVLRRIVDLRHRYAHGLVEASSSGALTISSWNRGKRSTRTYESEEIGWLVWQAMVSQVELARLWAYFAPADPRWHLQSDDQDFETTSEGPRPTL